MPADFLPRRNGLKFSELVGLLEQHGFRIVKEKGSVRYYGKPGWQRLIRVDYHGSEEVPIGKRVILYLEAAGLLRGTLK